MKMGMRESHCIASSPEGISVLRTNVKSARKFIISRAPVLVNWTSPQNRFVGSTYAFLWQGEREGQVFTPLRFCLDLDVVPKV
jgi:hypothetical protein